MGYRRGKHALLRKVTCRKRGRRGVKVCSVTRMDRCAKTIGPTTWKDFLLCGRLVISYMQKSKPRIEEAESRSKVFGVEVMDVS